MKTIVINAGPKRKGVNAQIMKSAKKGAESVGSEVEYVDLYKLDLSGCRTCQICKNDEDVCKCYWRDEISPLIERILDCDCLLVGTPIFFSSPSSHYMALLERLIYCIVSFKTRNKFKGKVNVGLFYTINYPEDYFEKSVRPLLKKSEGMLKMLHGEVEIRSFGNIFRDDYKNASESLELEEKLRLKEEQLDADLDAAFDVAARLAK